jgi:DNA-binding NarL/FixJ family response regulator
MAMTGLTYCLVRGLRRSSRSGPRLLPDTTRWWPPGTRARMAERRLQPGRRPSPRGRAREPYPLAYALLRLAEAHCVAGRSNSEIAQALFISAKTASVHV